MALGRAHHAAEAPTPAVRRLAEKNRLQDLLREGKEARIAADAAGGDGAGDRAPMSSASLAKNSAAREMLPRCSRAHSTKAASAMALPSGAGRK